MDFRRISFRDINLEDRTFEIRKFGSCERLHGSLARSGMLDPPWIWKRVENYVVVDGFKRIEWAANNGRDGAVCLVLPEELRLWEVWERRLEKKLFEPEMDIAEKARILSILLELFPPGDIPRPFLTELNVSPRPEVLKSWLVLAGETPEILAVLASGEIAERAALELARWDQESRAAALSILVVLRCSASIQAEIIERVDEISIREGQTRIELLQSPQVSGVLSATGANHRRKTQELRDLLSEMRFPRLRARERRFQESVRSLSLPPSVRIVPPPAFEGTGWKLELSFSNPEEFRTVYEKAGGFMGPGRLDGVFEPEGSGGGPEKR